LVVHDPAAETLQIVRTHRELMGRTVRVISLEPTTDGVNVLEWLDPNSQRISLDVRTVVSWLDSGESGGQEGDDSFAGLARTLCVALILYALTSDAISDDERHLLKVRQLGALEEHKLRDLLRSMIKKRDVARGAMANAAGFVLTTMKSAETYAGVNMHFETLTSCLEGTEAILCGQVAPERRFKLRDVLSGNTDFYICLPPDMLDAQPQIPRVLLGALSMMYLRNLQRAKHDALFIVDEMPRLGKLKVLSTARDIARKYGLYLWAIVQDLGQLEEAYKKTGERSWLATPAVKQFFGVNDLETAKMLSELCGYQTALVESTSVSTARNRGKSGGATTTTSRSTQPQKVPLIAPEDILRLATDEEGRPEEQLLFITQQAPLRCGLPKYFRRRELAGLVEDNPFYKPPKRKLTGEKLSQRLALGAFAAMLVGLSVQPLQFPLVAGEEAVVSAPGLVPIYWPATGQQVGELQSGWAVMLKSFRSDGFAEVGTMVDGKAYDILIRKDALSR
jgi:type IV secretion system protein VirD4